MRSDNQKPFMYVVLDEFGEPLRKYHTKLEAQRNLREGMVLLKLNVPKPPSVFETTEEAIF
jgi:hypothetical protein